jgi:uncharacterized membrane protein YdjX (TVP38/TMEM64 family)
VLSEQTRAPDEQRKKRDERLKRILALLVVVAISVFVFSLGDEVKRFERFGYPGIFLFTLLTYATVILPAPGATVVIAAGSAFDPFWVGVAAGAGAALGELSGYAAGYSGQAIVENVRIYTRLKDWMGQSPWRTFFGLILLSGIPNPAFDLAGIAAGALRIPIPRFLVALWVGETIKMWLFAYAGAYSIDWIMRLVN